jgi:SAM-dependent methyltransferase
MESLSLTVSAYREHSLMSHGIQHYALQWEKNAQQDPLWAILTDDRYAGGLWSLDDFFTTGENDIRLIFDYMKQSGVFVEPGIFLDFGCGVGRASRPLQTRFTAGYGVDISPRMIDLARQYVPKVNFHVNQEDSLTFVGSKTIDFVFSHIVLQHMNNDLQKKYIREFFRVLKPGGLAAFQIPTEILGGNREGLLIKIRDRLKESIPGFQQVYEHYRKKRKEKKQQEKQNRLIHLDPEITMEVCCLPDERVRELCDESGCAIERVAATNSLDAQHSHGKIEFYDPKKQITLLRRGRIRHLLSRMYFVRKLDI